MKSIDEFKERILNDPEFAKKLNNAKSIHDIVEVARANNYHFTDKELRNEEIGEDVLDAVAGGAEKGSTTETKTTVYGENYNEFVGTKEQGEAIANLMEQNK